MKPIKVKYPKDSPFDYFNFVWVDTIVAFNDKLAILVDDHGQVITTNISNIKVINQKALFEGADNK